jgi:site-specific DNA recombinase
MSGKNRLGCFGARDQGRCDNHLTIRRDEVEARVLRALQEKLLQQDLFEEFCDEFTREMNRLRMEHRASLSSAEREIERIETRRKKLIEMVMSGVPPAELKDEMIANAARREELKARLAAADAPPPLLHPEMAELYRQKVTTLAQALEHPETRTEASEALRGLIDAITLSPERGELKIELKGNLAAMLSAATNAKRSPETGDLSLQVQMVAGARNHHYLQLWRPAA